MINAKKGKWSPLKEMLFTYLAITKVLYWFNTFMAMNLTDIGEVGRAVLMRLLNQDMMIILFIVVMFFIERRFITIENAQNKIPVRIAEYAIGYMVLVGAYIFGFWIMNFIADFQIDWGVFIGYSLAGYVVVAVVMSINDYYKNKEKTGDAPSVHSNEEKLGMLIILRDDGVLTQEEFDSGKAKLAG